ncbi:uncharacterized protein B0T15DRAFT_261257 [Chaetomium strumarium]|uniref:Uncharacterized protein n=1 Tax=Chaetomium strumarium TaxID=1170767 RepID=A0AAJ0GN59_9PEZI|nr:hypothetical protein B0T15DRAFT_261257 [Chaetomium strumarium]
MLLAIITFPEWVRHRRQPMPFKMHPRQAVASGSTGLRGRAGSRCCIGSIQFVSISIFYWFAEQQDSIPVTGISKGATMTSAFLSLPYPWRAGRMEAASRCREPRTYIGPGWAHLKGDSFFSGDLRCCAWVDESKLHSITLCPRPARTASQFETRLYLSASALRSFDLLVSPD